MKHLVIVDPRAAFLQDLSTRVMLEERSLIIDTAKVLEELFQFLNQDSLVVICDQALDETAQNITNRIPESILIYGYSINADGIFKFSELGIPCLGVVTKSGALLDMLEHDQIPVIEGARRPQSGVRERQQEAAPPPAEQAYERRQAQTPAPEQSRRQGYTAAPLEAPRYEESSSPPARQRPQEDAYDSGYGDMQPQRGDTYSQPHSQTTAPYEDSRVNRQPDWQENYNTPQETAHYPNRQVPGGFITGAERLSGVRDERINSEADREIAEESRAVSLRQARKTKVITVYAAKGGVGKTTIAANVAVCMALTSSGRGKFRVCVADYNIDFGDVCTTLNLNPRGANMVHWAQDVRERVDRGEDPESISYDKRDMEETWLQQMNETGLYALIAPVVHEDSMDIGETELTVMMRSLIQNGEFDYIVCDTGNNTRDSSVIALETADTVLMIATQDVANANCNDAVISTLRKIGFDTDKIKLVINNIMSSQATGISVKDIEQSFPYDCVARIKRDEEVIKSNNTGVPMVYNPNHDFTKQIRAIIKYVTKGHDDGQQGGQQQKKKNGSGLSGFFGKKVR